MPPLVGLSSNHLTSDGAYLMDTGLSMFMWFGRAVSPSVISHLFGIPGLEGIDTSQLRLVVCLLYLDSCPPYVP